MTILVRVFTLIGCYKAWKDVFLMEEPVIKNVSVPIPLGDRTAVNFADYGYFLGFEILVYGGEASTVPKSVGSFIAEVIDISKGQSNTLDMKDCKVLISQFDASFESKNDQIYKKLNDGAIKCMDPGQADLSIYRDHVR